ncbi:hypothetical protein Tco_1097725, partial [Tanacetum coccineum]
FQVTPKSSHLSAVKRIFRYLKGKPKLGLWYPRVSSFDLESYSDSDYAGANLDRKSTTGGCQFLGRRLISWQCKKQTIVATSTTEAEYVAAASCCGQVLWIQNQMLDYGFNFMNTKIYIDNESTICIVKNPVYHSKTKHIAIRHHFIRDAYEKKLIQVLKIHTDDNVADLLTKAFDVSRSCISRGLKEFRELLSRVTNDQDKEIQALKAQITKLKKQAKPDIIDFSSELHSSCPPSSGENLGGHSSSDKSLSGNEDEMTIQSVYDICLSLCKQVSDQAKEIKALKAQITKLKKQAKPVIKHHRAYMKSVSAKHRFPRKSFSKKHKVHKESVSKQVDYMDTKNAQDEGMTREVVDADKEIEENELSTEEVLSMQEVRVLKEYLVMTGKELVLTLKKITSHSKPLQSLIKETKGRRRLKRMMNCESESGVLLAEKKFKQLKQGLRQIRLLADELQEQEREQFTIEERAKFLHDTIAAQRRFLAQQRSEAIRNKPPTKNQPEIK